MKSLGNGRLIPRKYFGDSAAWNLIRAIESFWGRRAKIRRALELNREPLHATGKDGLTPLHWAILRSRFDAFKTLLELGADPNQKANNGESPTSLAALHPDPDYLRIALENGGNPDARDSQGVPLLSLAARNNRIEHAKLLLGKNAEVNSHEEQDGMTPLAVAVLTGWEEMISLLLRAGASPNEKDAFGMTPMEMSQESWRSPTVKAAFEEQVAQLPGEKLHGQAD